ncbi:hypothetical protein CC86DRAFT_466688 [Ophiobolus disseminans]|uniref:DUF2293 domain-containing protein n=1 Tax=Ophiobolus disseminans TaxID=1469910 RepID=A0A6A7A1B2_9PLEO|nr:hypothetical protein CC86DRAFT_466688 [Ophiobolus disseminans]
MPKGYALLPKGIAYKTLHCRKLTREAGMPLYVVMDKKTTLGLRAPKSIVSQVHLKAKDTLATRRAATSKRDAADIAKAAASLRFQFPKISTSDEELVLKHGFKKHSGRVGRTGSIPLEKKVLLAVIAHIRHKHTEYDALLRSGTEREAARKLTRKKIETTMRTWGFTEDISWYFSSGKKAMNAKSKLHKRTATPMEDFDTDDSMDAEYVYVAA